MTSDNLGKSGMSVVQTRHNMGLDRRAVGRVLPRGVA
jgi:hypothetical protein